MPAAASKAELLAVCDKEFAKLDALIAPIDAMQAGLRDADGVSIKDVVGHRAHWIGLYEHWRAEGLAGRRPPMPAPGYKWSQLKAYNAALRVAQAGLSWPDAVELLRAAHQRLRARIESESEAALYGGPMPGGGNAWTAGRWAEAAGPSHYRSAAKHIRARLREMG